VRSEHSIRSTWCVVDRSILFYATKVSLFSIKTFVKVGSNQIAVERFLQSLHHVFNMVGTLKRVRVALENRFMKDLN